MNGERTPNLPKESDALLAAASWFGDPKKTKKFLADAAAVVKRNEALLATIGKASEIEKLHAEAQEHKDLVLSEIERREGELETAKTTFAGDLKRRNGEFNKRMGAEKAKAQKALQEAEIARNEARRLQEAATQAHADAAKAKSQAERDAKKAKDLKADLEARVKRARAIEEAAA